MKQLLLSVLAIVLVGSISRLVVAESAKGPAIGSAAPGFALVDQNGKSISLDQYKDKVVVLEWFNDGCPFVQKFYNEGHMNRQAGKYIEKGVVWLAINTTKTASVEHNKKVANDWAMNRPILDDSKGAVGRQYASTNTPGMFIINKGVLVYKGAIDSTPTNKTTDIAGATNYVSKALDEILEGKTVSEAETKPYGCTVKYAE